MPFRGTKLDREFLRQALAEKRLADGQLYEIMGAQTALEDRSIRRAIPILAHELGLLTRQLVEQLIRHVIRRCGPLRIGGYEIIRQLGRGGMGVVYLAEQLRMKRPVALKVLIRRDMSEKFIERFKREGRATARIRHQNLVAAFDVGEADGWNYFAMEYVDGPTVSRTLKENGPFSELEGIRLIRQVAEALELAHNAGILHRDIKPGNIIITKRGQAKLCDLGLARIDNVDESELYERGTTLGSRRYMSPEQARGLDNIDARSDIYSLGLTLFLMLTGTPPFSDVPKQKVLIEHLRGLLEWPSDINPNISQDSCEMIWRMSAREPDRRPRNARQLIQELKALERELTVSTDFGLADFEEKAPDDTPLPEGPKLLGGDGIDFDDENEPEEFGEDSDSDSVRL